MARWSGMVGQGQVQRHRVGRVAWGAVCGAAWAAGVGGFGGRWVGGQTWSGLSSFSNNWSQGTNWVGGVAPRNDGTASVTFAGSTRTSPNTDASWSISNLSFAANAAAFTLGGNLMTIGGNVTNNSANAQVINNVLSLSTSMTFQGPGPIVVNGGIANPFGTTAVKGTVTFAGAITSLAGSALRVDGGMVTLAGAGSNNFTGSTVINDGTLVLAKNNGVVSIPGTVTVGDGIGSGQSAELSIASNQQTTSLTDLTINSDGLLDFPHQVSVQVRNLTLAGGEIAFQGSYIVLNGDVTVIPSATPTYLKGMKAFGFDLNGTRTFNVPAGTPGGYDLSLTDTKYYDGTLVKMGAGVLRLSDEVGGGALTLVQGTVAVAQSETIAGGLLTLAGGTIRGDHNSQYDTDLYTGRVLVSGDTAVVQDPYSLTDTFNFGDTVSVSGSHALTFALNQATTFTRGIDATGPGNSLTLRGDVSQAMPVSVTFTGGTVAGNVTLDYGTFSIQGATVTATVSVGSLGSLPLAGTFAGSVINYGSVQVPLGGADVAGGFTNRGSLFLAVGSSLSVEGTGLDNESSVALTSATLLGTPFLNGNTIFGHGTLGGGGGLTNSGFVTASGGALILANGGGTLNLGNLATTTGGAIQVAAGTSLRNAGSLALNGAGVQGPGALTNAAGGTISGVGVISAPFVNAAGGTLVVTGGGLSVTPAFGNAGVITLQGLTASLTGGAIASTGTVQGFGSVGSALANASGLIEASGGTLGIYGGVTQGAGATMTVDAGAKLLISPGLAINAGLISLLGGTFDNGGAALNNTGTIAGFGVVRTGGLTNNGAVTFTGGNTSVNGPVTNAAGRVLRVLYNPAIFTGAFENDGTLLVTGTTLTVAAGGTSPAVPALSGTGSTTVSAGAALEVDGVAQGSVTIQGTGAAGGHGLLQVLARGSSSGPTGGRSVSVIGTLAIASDASGYLGTLDLANNDLVLTATAESVARAYVAAWYAAGARNGPGLSASLAGMGGGPDALATLGVITNGNGKGGALYATFDGVAVSASSVLVKYTYVGDTNLDGVVDGADLANLVAGMSGRLAGWVNGDVNYDGVVNGADLALLMSGLRGQGASLGEAGTVGGAGLVPEGGRLPWMVGAVMLVGGRRHRAGKRQGAVLIGV